MSKSSTSSINLLLILVIHETNSALFFNITGLFCLSLGQFPATVIVPITNIFTSA